MQFKVLFALAFATLAAAAVPAANTNPNPATPANPNKGTSTNQGTSIAPPFPGKDTIGGSECSSGHLRCCKFYSPAIVIILR